MTEQLKPQGSLSLKVPAMPKDANAAGDIFGGWVMAQMDSAAGLCASEVAHGRVVTAGVKEISFERPVKVGDTLAIYTDDIRVGRTSIRFRVEAWAIRYLSHVMERVTVSEFVMVALDEYGKPTPVDNS
ncbi:acyl-CoA thioesterase [Bartonella sp. LJL80]